MFIENSSISSKCQSALQEVSNTINLLAPEAKFRIKQLAYEFTRSNPVGSTKRLRAIMSTVPTNRLRVQMLWENAAQY